MVEVGGGLTPPPPTSTLFHQPPQPCEERMKFALALIFLATGPLWSQSPGIDPNWLKADSAAAKVEVTIVAGLTSANGGMNFNGASAGALTLTVPLKWTVVLHFTNNDQVLPH